MFTYYLLLCTVSYLCDAGGARVVLSVPRGAERVRAAERGVRGAPLPQPDARLVTRRVVSRQVEW